MSHHPPFVDVELIRDMLYRDEKYVKEFAGASIQSFSEFKESFREHVIAREMEELRRAGHKIKPAALMLNLNAIIDMYEKSKLLLQNDADDDELKELVDAMDTFCEQILEEFSEIA